MSEIWQSIWRYHIVNNNHLFINLCNILNYAVVNSDMQESIYDAFRLVY